MQLNEEQQLAADHFGGPCLVTAVPGSGKTATLTARVVNLVQKYGVSPKNILCLTFTNKAANEMKERVGKALGKDNNGVWISTFHRLCISILRKHGHLVSIYPNFTIYDERDQQDLLTKTARMHEEDNINSSLISFFARKANEYREEMEDESVFHSLFPRQIDIIRSYFIACDENNAVDFSGMLYKTWKILKDHPSVVEELQNRFKYVLVDEMQDTNRIQYEIVKYIAQHHNLFVVGDMAQCVRSGQKVYVDIDKTEIIDNLDVGDNVLAAGGNGTLVTRKIVAKNIKTGIRLETHIITESGHELRVTDNHRMFVSVGIWNPESPFFVYLMRKNNNFRVGTSQFYQRYRMNGFSFRCASEGADEGWIIEYCTTEKIARKREKYYSYSFGIPMDVFRSRDWSKTRRKNTFNQSDVDEIHRSIDSLRGAKLLSSMIGLDLTNSHWSKCDIRSPRQNGMFITLVGNHRHGGVHRFALRCSDENLISILEKRLGIQFKFSHYDVRFTKRAEGGRSSLYEILNIRDIAISTAKELNIAFRVHENAKILKGKSLETRNASSIICGDSVPVYKNGGILLDKVVKITTYPSCAKYFDFEIEDKHNFISEGIIHSNSIFGWRGARPENISQMHKDFASVAHVTLPKNYRSTKQILEIAQRLIRHNPESANVVLHSIKGSGRGVVLRNYSNAEEEAEQIVANILRLREDWSVAWNEIAVLYRTNAQSKLIEIALRQIGIPYRIFGGFSFFNRKEIKAALAYLTFLTNPGDTISFAKAMEIPPRGIGDTTIGRLEKICKEKNISIMDVISASDGIKMSVSARTQLHDFAKITQKYIDLQEQLSLREIVSGYLRETGFYGHIQSASEKDDDWQKRIENVDELLSGIADFDNGKKCSLSGYLQTIKTFSDNETEDSKDAVNLMTIHSSKGTEYDAVFVIGLNKGLLPHSMAMSEGRENEERRLAYVSITRARCHLYLSHYSQQKRFDMRKRTNAVKSVDRSPFLDDMGF